MDQEDKAVREVVQETRAILTSTNTSISTVIVMAVVWEVVAREVSRSLHNQRLLQLQ
jgi:hypothetical protein